MAKCSYFIQPMQACRHVIRGERDSAQLTPIPAGWCLSQVGSPKGCTNLQIAR